MRVSRGAAAVCVAATLAFAAVQPALAGFGCDTAPVFENSMTDQALKKFFLNTKGTEWPKLAQWRWDADDPCAWDGQEHKHLPPYGVRCVTNNAHHRPPPHGDGGLMYIEIVHGYADGEVPEEFKAFEIADAISLAGNKLKGNLWNTSYHCFLHRLNLARNEFSGELHPDFLRNALRHIEQINLAHNKFTGPLPARINTFETLQSLVVNDNQLSGTIPDLSLCKNLREINLANNRFSGSLSPWLKEMPSLAWLELDGNSFSGTLPDLPQTISHFSAGASGFSGTIPESYGSLGYLHVFNCPGCDLRCPRPDLLKHVHFSTHCK